MASSPPGNRSDSEALNTGTAATENALQAGCGPRPTISDLIADYHTPLFAYAYRLCGQTADAEDLLQQTFLIVHQRLDQLRDPQSAKGWLYAILRSAFLRTQRKQRPVVEVDLGMEDAESLERVEEDPLIWEIDREAVHEALKELPEDFRLVVLMHYFENLSCQEIADSLSLPLGTVLSRLSRGKGRLRRRLEGAGDSPKEPPKDSPKDSLATPGVSRSNLETKTLETKTVERKPHAVRRR